MTSASSTMARGFDHPGWDARSPGRLKCGMALSIRPAKERTEKTWKEAPDLFPDEARVRPARWTSAWLETLRNDVAGLMAGRQLLGAWTPALGVPRFVHGQSQGICDLWGVRVERQEDGNYFVHPLQPDPKAVEAIEPRAVETSMYWGTVEWITYARAATRGQFAFRNPVMTGPFDTVNYLLGTTVLMEWVYTEPSTVHGLLDQVTNVIIAMMGALQKAAGGTLHGDALACMQNAFCLCSECRSLVSKEIYEEFEAPYLKRIGQQLGPYGIHSCGSWERTVPSALQDPNLRAMNGQVRENDLAELCVQARGDVMLSIAPSENLPERYTWPNTRSFLEYVLKTAPKEQPLELSINESDLDLWNELCANIR